METHPRRFFARQDEIDLKQSSKRSLGAYFTPMPLVHFINKSVHKILKEEFNLESGVASSNIKLLDFAMGSGIFLFDIIQKALDVGASKEDIFENFYGYELDKESYDVACQNIEELIGKSKNLYNVNTLTKEAFDLFQINDNQIPIIVGNPPYSGFSENKETFISDLIEDYKYIAGERVKEKNIKSLQDDYVKFIRFAEHKLANSSKGIVALVTPHTFLDNPTSRGMRYSLLESFNQLRVVNLHGNSRKKETAPDGSKDENVFDIQQGILISFFIKKPDIASGVFYTDWWGTKEDKFNNCINLNV